MNDEKKIFENAIIILRKDQIARKPEELQFLEKFTSQIQFFQQYINEGNEDVHKKCCYCMKHEYYKQGDCIFQIGSQGTKFFIILDGQVGIYIKLPAPDQSQEQQQLVLPIAKVKVLHSGDSFGEQALLNNRPRLATVICEKNSHFGVLNRIDFNNILKQVEEEKFLKELSFLSTKPLFSSWNYLLLKNLYLNSKLLKLKLNEAVFEEGRESDYIYLIKSGEFSMVKQFARQLTEQEQNEQESEQIIKGGKMNLKKIQYAKVKVLVLAYQDIFGEEDLLKQQKRSFSVVCQSSYGELIQFSRSTFEHRILNDEITKNFIYNRQIQKWEQINKRSQQIQQLVNKYKNYYYSDNQADSQQIQIENSEKILSPEKLINSQQQQQKSPIRKDNNKKTQQSQKSILTQQSNIDLNSPYDSRLIEYFQNPYKIDSDKLDDYLLQTKTMDDGVIRKNKNNKLNLQIETSPDSVLKTQPQQNSNNFLLNSPMIDKSNVQKSFLSNNQQLTRCASATSKINFNKFNRPLSSTSSTKNINQQLQKQQNNPIKIKLAIKRPQSNYSTKNDTIGNIKTQNYTIQSDQKQRYNNKEQKISYTEFTNRKVDDLTSSKREINEISDNLASPVNINQFTFQSNEESIHIPKNRPNSAQPIETSQVSKYLIESKKKPRPKTSKLKTQRSAGVLFTQQNIDSKCKTNPTNFLDLSLNLNDNSTLNNNVNSQQQQSTNNYNAIIEKNEQEMYSSYEQFKKMKLGQISGIDPLTQNLYKQIRNTFYQHFKYDNDNVESIKKHIDCEIIQKLPYEKAPTAQQRKKPRVPQQFISEKKRLIESLKQSLAASNATGGPSHGKSQSKNLQIQINQSINQLNPSASLKSLNQILYIQGSSTKNYYELQNKNQEQKKIIEKLKESFGAFSLFRNHRVLRPQYKFEHDTQLKQKKKVNDYIDQASVTQLIQYVEENLI